MARRAGVSFSNQSVRGARRTAGCVLIVALAMFAAPAAEEIPTPGHLASGLAYDGGWLYLVEQSGFRQIYVLDPATSAVQDSFLAPSPTGFDGRGNPNDIVADGAGSLFISDMDGTVYQIDTAGTMLVNSFQVPHRGGAIAFDGTYLYVGDLDSTLVSVTEPDGTPVASFSLPEQRPSGMVFDPSTGDLWMVDIFTTRITQVTTAGAVVRSCEGPHTQNPIGLGGIALVEGQLYLLEVEADPYNLPDDPATIHIVDPASLSCTPPISDAGFFTAATLPAGGTGQVGIVVAALKGYGADDLVITNNTSQDASILLGDGLGGFTAAPNVPLGANPRGLRVADFNLDGKLDLAAAGGGSVPTVFIRLGVGNGAFGPPQDQTNVGGSPPGGLSKGLAVGDFNQDNKPDFAVGRQSNMIVRLGNGNGTFAPPASDIIVPMGGGNAVAAGAVDLDADGDLDLVVANGAGVCTMLGQGNGFFGPHACLAGGANGLAIGDLDLDGDPDLALAATAGLGLNIRLNDGFGGFGPPVAYPAVTSNDVAIVDVNLDGRPDVALATNVVQILLGDGTGAFFPTATYNGGGLAIATGHLGGQGGPDLAVVTSAANEVRILFNWLVDQDGDGIGDDIDKNLMTAADESAVPSNDFKEAAGGTAGTITDHGGWMVGIGNLTPGGVQAAITGSGSDPVIIESCPGSGPEQVWLDTSAERVKISCNPNITTATALLALPTIELRKFVNGILTEEADLDLMNPTASKGSPMTAGADNQGSMLVKYLSPGDVMMGSYLLDAGESVDTTASDSGIVAAGVLQGTVPFTLGGHTTRLRRGQSVLFLALSPAIGLSSEAIAKFVASGDIRRAGIAASLDSSLEHARRQIGKNDRAAKLALQVLRVKLIVFARARVITPLVEVTLGSAVDALIAVLP